MRINKLKNFGGNPHYYEVSLPDVIVDSFDTIFRQLGLTAHSKGSNHNVSVGKLVYCLGHIFRILSHPKHFRRPYGLAADFAGDCVGRVVLGCESTVSIGLFDAQTEDCPRKTTFFKNTLRALEELGIIHYVYSQIGDRQICKGQLVTGLFTEEQLLQRSSHTFVIPARLAEKFQAAFQRYESSRDKEALEWAINYAEVTPNRYTIEDPTEADTEALVALDRQSADVVSTYAKGYPRRLYTAYNRMKKESRVKLVDRKLSKMVELDIKNCFAVIMRDLSRCPEFAKLFEGDFYVNLGSRLGLKGNRQKMKDIFVKLILPELNPYKEPTGLAAKFRGIYPDLCTSLMRLVLESKRNTVNAYLASIEASAVNAVVFRLAHIGAQPIMDCVAVPISHSEEARRMLVEEFLKIGVTISIEEK